MRKLFNVFFGWLVVVGLSARLPLEAQNVSKLAVTPFSEAGVSISLLDPTTARNFYGPFGDDPDISRLLPFAIVLTNSTGKNVVAVTVRWTWSDSGREHTMYYRTDSLFMVRVPVVRPNSKILLTPSFTMLEFAPQRGLLTASPDIIRMDAERFEKSPKVRVALDTAIFEDGLLIGPDESDTAGDIQGRRLAAESVGRDVIDKIAKGEDPTAMLSTIAATDANRQDRTAVWLTRLAKSLLRSRNQRGYADALLSLPAITLHRNQ